MSKRTKLSTKIWLIITALIILPAILLAIYRLACISEFDRRVDALRAQGLPASMDDLEKTYTIPDGAQNAANVYITAFQNKQRPTAEAEPLLPTTGSYRPEDETAPYPQEVIDAIESYLQQNQKTLDLLDQAAKIEHCLWPRKRDSCMLSNTQLSEIKRTVELLCDRNIFLAYKGNTEKLVQSIETAVKLSKSLSKQPYLIDHLVTISLKARIVANLEDIMIKANFTDRQLTALQETFANMHRPDAFYKTLIVERCCALEFWELPLDEQADGIFMSPPKPAHVLYSALGIKQRDALTFLDMNEKNITASKLPPHLRNEAFIKIEDEIDLGIIPSLHLYLYVATTPTKIMQHDLRLLALLKCGETALAIERYRQAHNTIPDSLEALVPQFMAELPRDPFDNNTLRYIKLDNGYKLYSIAEDETDNDGLSKYQIMEQKPSLNAPAEQYDYPFTITW